jgi:hypothetical protein
VKKTQETQETQKAQVFKPLASFASGAKFAFIFEGTVPKVESGPEICSILH